jgi:hypothetical protein
MTLWETRIASKEYCGWLKPLFAENARTIAVGTRSTHPAYFVTASVEVCGPASMAAGEALR